MTVDTENIFRHHKYLTARKVTLPDVIADEPLRHQSGCHVTKPAFGFAGGSIS